MKEMNMHVIIRCV